MTPEATGIASLKSGLVNGRVAVAGIRRYLDLRETVLAMRKDLAALRAEVEDLRRKVS